MGINANTDTPISQRTHKTGGALVADRFVKGPNAAIVQTVAGDNAIGVVKQTAAGAGEFVTVTTDGDTRVEAGAAISDNDLIQSDASGRAITKAAGATLGRALSAATAAGQFISLKLIPN
jgi:hypothetical protein